MVSSLFVLSFVLMIIMTTKLNRQNCSFEVGLDRLENTKWRNISAFFIVVHHECWKLFSLAHISGKLMIVSFTNIGHIFVTLFFFWSGYGLGNAILNKDAYLKSFFKKNILPLFLITTITNIIKTLISICFLDGKPNFLSIARNILMIDLIDSTEWYLIVLLFVYVIFLFIEKHLNNTDVFCYILFYIAYVVACLQLGVEEHWFVSVGAWIIGFVIGKKAGQNIKSFLNNKYICALSLVLGMISEILLILNSYTIKNYVINIVLLMQSGLLLCMFCIMVSGKIILPKWSLIVGDISLGVYIWHNIVFDLVYKYVELADLAFFMSLIILLPLSYVTQRFFIKLKKICIC